MLLGMSRVLLAVSRVFLVPCHVRGRKDGGDMADASPTASTWQSVACSQPQRLTLRV